MKALFARWMAGRLENRARSLRRSLRDYQRRESAGINVLEQRSRGLRLYAAWAQKGKPIRIHEAPVSLSLPAVSKPSFREVAKAAA